MINTSQVSQQILIEKEELRITENSSSPHIYISTIIYIYDKLVNALKLNKARRSIEIIEIHHIYLMNEKN